MNNKFFMTQTISVAIIGSGPAAYAAAEHCIKFQTVLFEGEIIGANGPGGQLTTTTDVDNFPGFINISGPDLMDRMKEKIKSYKKIKILPETVVEISKEENKIQIKTKKRKIFVKVLIIATGAQAKRLYVKGTDEFWQKGISSCAVCDGFAFKNKKVVIIGGGDSAMEEIIYMSKIAREVISVHRSNIYRAKKILLDKAKKLKNVIFITNQSLLEAKGGDQLEEVIFSDNLKLKTDGLFFAIGHSPNIFFINDLIAIDEANYIITNDDMQTNQENIFACGDVQDKVYRQAITAAASGSIAGRKAVEFLCKDN